jgi:hypothetical protein
MLGSFATSVGPPFPLGEPLLPLAFTSIAFALCLVTRAGDEIMFSMLTIGSIVTFTPLLLALGCTIDGAARVFFRLLLDNV